MGLQYSKGFFTSKTFWGVMIALIGGAVGWNDAAQAAIAEDTMAFIEVATAFVGAALALYGRVNANTQIKGLMGGTKPAHE